MKCQSDCVLELTNNGLLAFCFCFFLHNFLLLLSYQQLCLFCLPMLLQILCTVHCIFKGQRKYAKSIKFLFSLPKMCNPGINYFRINRYCKYNKHNRALTWVHSSSWSIQGSLVWWPSQTLLSDLWPLCSVHSVVLSSSSHQSDLINNHSKKQLGIYTIIIYAPQGFI